MSKKSGYTSPAQLLCRMQLISTVYNLLIGCSCFCFFFLWELIWCWSARVWPQPQLSCMRIVAVSMSGHLPCSSGPRFTDLPSQLGLIVSLSPQPCPAIRGSVWPWFPSPGLPLPPPAVWHPSVASVTCSGQVGYYKINNGKGHKIHDFLIKKT